MKYRYTVLCSYLLIAKGQEALSAINESLLYCVFQSIKTSVVML